MSIRMCVGIVFGYVIPLDISCRLKRKHWAKFEVVGMEEVDGFFRIEENCFT